MKLFPTTILFIALAIIGSVHISDLHGSVPDADQNTGDSRTIRLSSTPGVRGATVGVPVVFSSQGNEAAILFTIAYNPEVLSSPDIMLAGGAPDSSSLTVNAAAPGKLVILVDWDNPITAGDLYLLTMSFAVNTGTTVEETLITLDECNISDKNAQPLTAPGDLTVIPITAAKIAGRVLTPDGRGLRNATVVLTDPDGATRRTTTGSLGYFEFADVAVGVEYDLQVQSKRFRFTTRSVLYDGSAVDIVGIS